VKGFSDCSINTFNERASKSRYPCIYDLPDKVRNWSNVIKKVYNMVHMFCYEVI